MVGKTEREVGRVEEPNERPGGEGLPLEPGIDDMRRIGGGAVEALVEFVQRQPEAPAVDLDGMERVLAEFAEPPPPSGRSFPDVLEAVLRGADKAFNTTGPGYLAFIPGGGLYSAAVADFLACGLNRFVNVWNAAPAFARIEATVIRWLCDLFGYPQEGGGILTSGGSMANFSAIVAARHGLLGDDLAEGTVYFSEQTHASVAKAARLAGIPGKGIRWVPCRPNLSIDVDALLGMVREDRLAGRRPFCVVANAGTTNTGAVDPLGELAEVARDEALWLHVDAAYGGPFQLTERGRALFRGIERADSITLDPHKAMFLPYGTGSLLVGDRARLRDAHRVGAEYLQDLAAEEEVPNFTDYSPELSRDFRGLRVWLPLQVHGIEAFRAALDEKLDLARFLDAELRRTPGFELPWETQVTVVAFRYRPQVASMDPEEFNRRLLERINASRRVFLSSTLVDGRFVLRACIVSHRTHRDRIEEAVEIIQKAAADLDR